MNKNNNNKKQTETKMKSEKEWKKKEKIYSRCFQQKVVQSPERTHLQFVAFF